MYLLAEFEQNQGLSFVEVAIIVALNMKVLPRPLQQTRITSLTSILSFVSLHFFY